MEKLDGCWHLWRINKNKYAALNYQTTGVASRIENNFEKYEDQAHKGWSQSRPGSSVPWENLFLIIVRERNTFKASAVESVNLILFCTWLQSQGFMHDAEVHQNVK